MDRFFEQLSSVNSVINEFVWVKIGLILLIGTGILMTCCTKFFQVGHVAHWWKETIVSVFKKDSASTKKTDKKSISQFQALCTALAATIGTGNIAGVAAAICLGGPGAVFWMWFAAFLGMMTNYSENVLGIFFRRRNKDGEWSGGAMYYIKDGLGKKKGFKQIAAVLAVLFAIFAILASFGIGNMGQVNKITLNMESAFFSRIDVEGGYVEYNIDPEDKNADVVDASAVYDVASAAGADSVKVTDTAITVYSGTDEKHEAVVSALESAGISAKDNARSKNVTDITVGGVPLVGLCIGVALLVLGAIIIIGGLQRIASVAETVVPFMAIAYVVGSFVLIGINYNNIIPAFGAIFKGAFNLKAGLGGLIGTTIVQGCKRGVFSNEAGLGSSVMVHSSSNVKEPVRQGMWGIFEVFFDTMIVCTMTALVVLTSGKINLDTGKAMAGVNDATLVSEAFGGVFGVAGEWFIAVAMLLFAFTTVLGWSQYGSKAVEYLFGVKGVKVYKVIFVLMIVSGAVMTSSIAWDISDTFNGLMMVPNLIGVVALFPLVMKITNNYVNRVIKGKKEKPMLSFDNSIQAEMEKGFEQ